MRQHARAHFLTQRFDIGGGSTPQIEQEIAVLFADLRSAVRQASAPGGINQFPGLAITGRILEGGTARSCAHRLRGFACSANFSKPRRDGSLVTSSRAQPCPHYNTTCRQLRMTIGEV